MLGSLVVLMVENDGKSGLFCPGILVSYSWLVRWVEHHLQPFAQQHTSYIKDARSFLKHLEYINKTKAPLSDTTKLISWDIVNLYPNCNTKMCIEAIKRVLQAYPHIDLKVPTESIIEALEITMSSDNTKFGGRFFTQSNGATMGGRVSKCHRHIWSYFYRSSSKGRGTLHF